MRSRNLLPLTALIVACSGCTSVPTLLAEERFHEALSKTSSWDYRDPEVRLVGETLSTRLEGQLGIHVLTEAELDELLPWVPVQLREQKALVVLVEYRLDRSDAPKVKVSLEAFQVGGVFHGYDSELSWRRLNAGHFAPLRPRGGKGSGGTRSGGGGLLAGLKQLSNFAVGAISDAVWAGSLGTVDVKVGGGPGAEVSPLRAIRSAIKQPTEGTNPVAPKDAVDPESARTEKEKARAAKEKLRAEKQRSDEARDMLSRLIDWPRVQEDGTTQALFLLGAEHPSDEWFEPYGREQDVVRLEFFHAYPHDAPCPFGNRRGCAMSSDLGLPLPEGPNLAERINALFPQGPRPLDELPFVRTTPER